MTELLICGGARLARHYCEKCEQYSLVGTRIKKCPDCGRRFDMKKKVTLKKIGCGVDRKSIPQWFKTFLIDKQNGKCYWCNKKLGFHYVRNGMVKK